MAQSNPRKVTSGSSQLVNCHEPDSSSLNTLPETTLSVAAVADYVLGARAGSVVALGGINIETLRFRLDQVDFKPQDRRVLFTCIEAAPTTDEIVEQVVDLLAETALRLWPLWFTDVSFAECRSDPLGQL